MFFDTPEDFVNCKLNCNSWVATAIIGSAALGALTKTYTASQAAGAQVGATGAATNLLKEGALRSEVQSNQFYDKAIGQLAPYQALGKTGIDELTSRLSTLTTPVGIPQEMLDLQAPINITQEELEKLPGYQFASTQGLKATQNSAAARGLGVSGAALKGAATFAKGLADSTFTNYFDQQMQNRQAAFGRYGTTTGLRMQQQGTAFDRLKSLIDTGAAASSVGASAAVKTGSDITGNYMKAATGSSSNTIGAGNAEAAAINSTGDAWSKAFSDVGGYMAYKGLYGAPSGTPNMSFILGTAGNQYVPTFGK